MVHVRVPTERLPGARPIHASDGLRGRGDHSLVDGLVLLTSAGVVVGPAGDRVECVTGDGRLSWDVGGKNLERQQGGAAEGGALGLAGMIGQPSTSARIYNQPGRS